MPSRDALPLFTDSGAFGGWLCGGCEGVFGVDGQPLVGTEAEDLRPDDKAIEPAGAPVMRFG